MILLHSGRFLRRDSHGGGDDVDRACDKIKEVDFFSESRETKLDEAGGFRDCRGGDGLLARGDAGDINVGVSSYIYLRAFAGLIISCDSILTSLT